VTLASTDPLIGRERELELMRDLLSELTSGSAASVLIEGEAGIGKTRLLMSLVRSASERGVMVLRRLVPRAGT
jgi:predicted ATPase